MIDILRTNNFNTSQVSSYDKTITNKRAKHTERRILKGFNISTVDTLQAAFAEKENNSSKDFFKVKSIHKLSNLSRMPMVSNVSKGFWPAIRTGFLNATTQSLHTIIHESPKSVSLYLLAHPGLSQFLAQRSFNFECFLTFFQKSAFLLTAISSCLSPCPGLGCGHICTLLPLKGQYV